MAPIADNPSAPRQGRRPGKRTPSLRGAPSLRPWGGIPHELSEFWYDGSHRTAPGWSLGVTRILMGFFWLSQLGSSFVTVQTGVPTVVAGVLLTLGLLTRVGAAIGVVLAVFHGAGSSLQGQPLWPSVLLAIVHLLLLATSSGQNLGIDQILMQRLANWPSRSGAWMLRLRSLL